MTDQLPTVWEAKAHTFVKHKILESYLGAWTPIMVRQFKEKNLLFIDGFAGPGKYSRGEDGSPILALKSILNHPHDFPIPINFLFIENDIKRFETLKSVIGDLQSKIDASDKIKKVSTKQGDCETILNETMDSFEKQNMQFGPALIFLDQFGYSDISMNLIRRIMKQPSCEVFSYLNWEYMNRFITDQTKWDSISNAFGGEKWKEVLQLQGNKKTLFMLETYKNALKIKANSKYVLHFAMCDENDKLIYWLFFCTNNLRGLAEMKKSMCKVDLMGGFRFSDKDNPSQLCLFENQDYELLAQDIFSTFSGKKCTISQINEFVLMETPSCLFKESLKILEKEGKLKVINPPIKRRKGTFPDDDMLVEFPIHLF